MHVVQTQWDQCWDAGKIGTGLLNGHFHACVSYTHTHGERNRYLEFSRPILRDNKPAGILTRLDNVTGKPVISSMSDLDGVTVVDVRGWAPTGDTLGFVENTCTGKPFKGFKIVQPDESGNDAALRMLLEGKADAMYVYADQAARLECEEGVSADWDCDLWKGFGKTFAYIHTGMFGYAVAGTTLTIAKKGAGVAGILDKCIDRFVKTKWYFHLCKKYDLVDSGFPNQYFPQGAATPRIWDLPSTNHTASCLDGYCGCI